jgi:hypothetical protein
VRLDVHTAGHRASPRIGLLVFGFASTCRSATGGQSVDSTARPLVDSATRAEPIPGSR